MLVVENKGPIAALKESTRLLKRTWGEQLAGNVGFGLIFGLLMLAPMLLIFLGVPGNATALASAFLGFTTSGLTLRNFSVDYDPLPFSQFDQDTM